MAFSAQAAATAATEWDYFDRQTYDANGRVDHRGHLEGDDPYYKRIGVYWLEGTNTHGLDGRNHDWPWSAAFISWVMKTAGAGTRFRYSTQHSVYISQSIRDFQQQRTAAGYWGRRLQDAAPTVGDIVCWARQPGIDYDHQQGGDYKGHTDVVVEVTPDTVWIIGGNVGDSVTRRPLPLAGGRLPAVTQNGEVLFALMQNRLDQ